MVAIDTYTQDIKEVRSQISGNPPWPWNNLSSQTSRDVHLPLAILSEVLNVSPGISLSFSFFLASPKSPYFGEAHAVFWPTQQQQWSWSGLNGQMALFLVFKAGVEEGMREGEWVGLKYALTLLSTSRVQFVHSIIWFSFPLISVICATKTNQGLWVITERKK